MRFNRICLQREKGHNCESNEFLCILTNGDAMTQSITNRRSSERYPEASGKAWKTFTSV